MIPSKPPAPSQTLTPVTHSKLLLVEGDTPMHFLEKLLQDLGLSPQIEIRNFRGVKDFKKAVIDLAATDEFQKLVTSVGVVRDAEDKPALDARKSVENAFAAAGLTPVRQPPIRSAVYILPDDANPGMIETLCMAAVQKEPALSSAYACVEEFFVCLGKNKIALPGQPALAKNHAQA
jgi:hypothetical protein